MNTLIFLRHAATQPDSNVPISQWVLTPEGQKSAQELTQKSAFDHVDIIFTSTEPKAIQTARPLAEKLNLTIQQVSELGELNRDKGGYVTKEQYESIKQNMFNDFSLSENSWETMNDALERFTQAINVIDKEYTNKTILVTAHGTVISLYFSFVEGDLGNARTRHANFPFCGWGIIKNNTIIKDII